MLVKRILKTDVEPWLRALAGKRSAHVPVCPFRCVGCGRCVDTCMSKLGMIRVIRELLEKTEAAGRGPGEKKT